MVTRDLTVVSHTGLMSGAETVLLRLVSAARDDGWRVTVLCPSGPFHDRLVAESFTVERIPELKLPALPRPAAAAVVGARSLAVARRLRRRDRTTDLVLANGILALPALWAARLSALSAWVVHDVIRRRDWRFVLRRFGRAPHVAVAVSEAAAAPLRREGLPAVVIRNGTRWPVEPVPLDHRPPFVVGCAAVLTSWKGQHVLLDACERLDRDDVVVELAGGRFPKDQDYVAGLEQRAASSRLAGRVRVLGHVADLPARMRTWSVGVLASTDPEAGPLGLLEHMSMGLPVVATDHGGAPEVLDGAGLLVPPSDASALAHAIGRLLDDPELRRRCHRAGPERVEAGLTIDEQRRRFLDLLADVTSSRTFGTMTPQEHAP